MNILQQQSLHQLIGQSNLADAGADELFQLTDSHPYFSIPHFFLTKKLKEEKHSGFINQLQKTTLFFRNPYWLHYQLSPTTQQIQIVSKEAKEETTEPLLNQVIQEEIENSIHAAREIEIEKIEPEVSNEVLIEEASTVTQDISVDEIIHESTNLNGDKLEKSEPLLATETSQVTTIEQDVTAAVTTEEITASNLEGNNNILNSIEFNIPQKNIVVTELSNASITSFALEATEENEPIDEPIVEANTIVTSSSSIEDIDQVLDEIEVEGEPTIIDEKITNLLKVQLEAFKQPVATDTKLDIETEPYHTVDYFASQGIKPEIDHTAEDSLSKQLRKFTDWLKHMKNVPPSNEDLGTDPELETAIQGIAQTSNEAKEIVTETMAEVLVKQGKIDKAIQLYIKLSFLNPDKSAYFASKIQILKGI